MRIHHAGDKNKLSGIRLMCENSQVEPENAVTAGVELEFFFKSQIAEASPSHGTGPVAIARPRGGKEGTASQQSSATSG